MRKRIWALMFAAILALGTLTACAGKTNTNNNGTTDVTSEEPTKETETLSPNVNKDMENLKVDDVIDKIVTGINIGNTLDTEDSKFSPIDLPYRFETGWGNPKVTQEWIDACLDAGFNVIRIPVSWGLHVSPAPNYNITESWMNRVQEVVDYVYNRGAYVILNNHHGEWNCPYYDKQEEICAEMTAIWTQIAERFKDYDEHLIFEGQNEPRKIGTSVEWNGGDKEGWEVVNATNKAFIEAVRKTGGSNPYRILMIPEYAASSSSNAMSHLELPEDDRVIISVHAYAPYNFALNTNGTPVWNEAKSDIDNVMRDIKKYFLDKGYRVIIGEYGALNKENEEERAKWIEYYLSEAKKIGVPCVWWDNGYTSGNGELFGLINRRTNEIFYPLIVEAIQKVYDIK